MKIDQVNPSSQIPFNYRKESKGGIIIKNTSDVFKDLKIQNLGCQPIRTRINYSC